MTLSKVFLATVAAATLSAGSAMAAGTGVDFQVNEGVVPGSFPNIVTADSFNFDYSATINQSLVGGSLSFDDPFTETGSLSASAFTLNNVSQSSQLNGLPFLGGYGIVGDFTATGVAGLFGAGIKAIFSTFDLSLYIDSDQNGIGDMLLGTASIASFSEANIFGGLANGDYDVVLLFTPTAFGDTYFIDPTPFLMELEVTGVTTTITGASLTGPFVASVNGSGNAFVNNIPEPATLLLAGLGLLGLGGSTTWRKRKS